MEIELHNSAANKELEDVSEKITVVQLRLARLEHALYLEEQSRLVMFRVTEDEQKQLEEFLDVYRWADFD